MEYSLDPRHKIPILLVDDKPDNLAVLQSVLGHPDYELVLAESGEDAIAHANAREFAAILLDVQMPRIDGITTAKEIRAGGHSIRSPIIFLTALYRDDLYINLGYEAGAVDCLFKPYDPQILRSKVRVFADLYATSKKVLQQSERIREAEQNSRDRELTEIRFRSLQREHQLQRKYVDLVNSIDNCIIWAADNETLKFLSVSPSSQALTGFKANELVDCLDYWVGHAPPEDAVQFLAAIDKARSGRPTGVDHRFISKSGNVIWFNTRITLAEQDDRSGQRELRGLTVDVTTKKETELQLKRSEEAQRFLAEAGTHLAASLDYNMTLAKIANLVVPKFGTWCAIHLVGDDRKIRTVAAAHRDPEKIQLIESLDQLNLFSLGKRRGIQGAIKTGRSELVSEVSRDFLLATSDLHEGPGAFNALEEIKSYICVPMCVRDRVLGTISFVSDDRRYQQRDLTFFEELARRAALAIDNAILYQRAEKAVHTKDEFLSIASHELRTPLTPLKIQIQNLARLVRDDKFDTITPQLLTKVMEKCDRQLNRLNSLIENLLSVSQISLERLKLDRATMDLGALVLDVVDQFRDPLVNANCSVVLDLEENVIGQWDEFKLEQVLINLLTNAIKYGSGNPITIQVSQSESGARVSVKDLGIGIAPLDHLRVFELFERAAPSQNYGGLGLGLFIAGNVIKQHGGWIRVESSIGKGAQFIFEIPLTNTPKTLALPVADTTTCVVAP